MSNHARLSPSASRKWISCPGSLKLEESFPNISSEHADKGTACHTVASECLTDSALVPSDWINDRVRVSNPGEDPRFVEFDEVLCAMVTEYVNAVKALAVHGELHVEQKVEFGSFVGVAGQFGTVDAIIFRDDGEMLCIDLKTGYKFVEAEKNSQLMLYALGAYHQFELSHDIRQVRLMIFQPRHGGMREEVISIEDLLEFAKTAKEAARLVELATERHAPMHARGDGEMWERTYLNPTPNEKDCAFCRAISVCPSARRKLEETVGEAFDVIVEKGPASIGLGGPTLTFNENATQRWPDDDTALGAFMSATDFLEDWIKAVRAEVERRLMLGEEVPGYGLELGRQGARAWTNEEEAERMVREQFRIRAELAYKMKLHSPTQLEKLSFTAKPTKKNPNPTKSVITAKQWEKLCALIKRSDAVPSVKPVSQIKVPYRVAQPGADAFDVVPEEDQLW